MDTIKIQLEDQDIPKQWYHIAADFKTPMLPGGS
jgi:predicted alternative tryptophan synthase beta-subunit